MEHKSQQADITRRTVLGGLVGMTATGLSMGKTDPSGIPNAIIVPGSPGGNLDSLGRKLAELLGKTSNSPLIVENISGASGTIAVDQLLKRPRDGATLLLGNSGLICSAPLLLKTQQRFDPQIDLAAICTVAKWPFLLFTRKDHPANNLKELQQLYQGNSDNLGITYAANEVGSANHIAGSVIIQRLGLRGVHIPYRNIGQGVIDVIEGRVTLGIFGFQNISAFLEYDKAKVICALSDTPLNLAPQAKTVKDQGFGNFDILGWVALFVAGGTPQSIIQEQGRMMDSIFNQGDIYAFFNKMGYTSAFRNHENSNTFVNGEIDRYRGLLQQYGII